MLLVILIVALVIALGGGAYGHSRQWGAVGWSPLAVIVVVFVILLFTGALRR